MHERIYICILCWRRCSVQGVDTGVAEMIVKASKSSDAAYVSGLESSVSKGEGLAIEPFRPMRQNVSISKRMALPLEVAERLKAQQTALAAAAAEAADGGSAPSTSSLPEAAPSHADNGAAASSSGRGSAPLLGPRIRCGAEEMTRRPADAYTRACAAMAHLQAGSPASLSLVHALFFGAMVLCMYVVKAGTCRRLHVGCYALLTPVRCVATRCVCVCVLQAFPACMERRRGGQEQGG